MAQQFEINLVIPKSNDGWVVIGIIGVAFAVIPATASAFNTGWPLLWSFVWSFSVMYSLYRFLKQRVKKCIVSVEATQMTVLCLNAATHSTIPFANVLTYRYFTTKGNRWLIFKMKTGAKVKINANDIFGHIGNFAGLVEVLENATAQFREQHPGTIVRDPRIF